MCLRQVEEVRGQERQHSSASQQPAETQGRQRSGRRQQAGEAMTGRRGAGLPS